MKVESLFVDEGFGSLDPVKLNIAMDALERLHNQGRKVGVIFARTGNDGAHTGAD
jgi:exonuclease SbcC